MTAPAGMVGMDQATLLLVAESTVLEEIDREARGAGHRVLTARDGAAALRTLPTEPIDLVICEAALSESDGFEVCRAIRQAPLTRELPVVLIGTDADRQRARSAGATGLASPPVDPGLILALLQVRAGARARARQLWELEGLAVTLGRGLDDRDPSSAGLAERVAFWSMELGAALGLSEDHLPLLYKAAILHDVGRLGVPQSILMKPGPLDPGELEQVRRHAVLGEEILRPLPSSDEVLPAVRHHHERWDGQGYPDGLKGEGIPLFARIIAIADVFVALTSDRPWRSRRSRAEAVSVLEQGGGRQWEGTLVARFLALLREIDSRRQQALPSAG